MIKAALAENHIHLVDEIIIRTGPLGKGVNHIVSVEQDPRRKMPKDITGLVPTTIQVGYSGE